MHHQKDKTSHKFNEKLMNHQSINHQSTKNKVSLNAGITNTKEMAKILL